MASNLQDKTVTMETLINDLERTRKKQKVCKRYLNESIDKVIEYLETSSKNIDSIEFSDEADRSKVVNEVMQSLYSNVLKTKPMNTILNTHKEYYAYVSKLGKNVDKFFNKELNNNFCDVKFDSQLIDDTISEHLMREGKFEIAQTLQKESGCMIDEIHCEKFRELHQIINEIKKSNLIPAIEWAERNAAKLKHHDSDLLFNFHKMHYVSLVKNGQKDKAIAYARKNFPRFLSSNQSEVQRLLASLLYLNNLENSPYADLYNAKNWEKICELFMTDACKINELPPESLLYLTTTAGTLAYPKFLKLSNIMTTNPEWTLKNEIPIEVELGKNFKFHSIFVCPVSREVSTPDNPPMLLKCGHVISKLSLKKMTSNPSKPKFKCPYCPMEQPSNQPKELHF